MNLTLIGILVALLAFAGYTAYERKQAADAAVAKLEAQQEAAAKQAQDAINAAVEESKNHITDMEAAYEAGEANAKVVTQRIYVQGQANVAKDAGLSNPVCVMDDDSLQFLRGALSGMRSATYPAGAVAAMPGSGAAGKRDVRSVVPQQPEEHRTVGSVHTDARPIDSSGEVPAAGVSKHPKPKPIN